MVAANVFLLATRKITCRWCPKTMRPAVALCTGSICVAVRRLCAPIAVRLLANACARRGRQTIRPMDFRRWCISAVQVAASVGRIAPCRPASSILTMHRNWDLPASSTRKFRCVTRASWKNAASACTVCRMTDLSSRRSFRLRLLQLGMSR